MRYDAFVQEEITLTQERIRRQNLRNATVAHKINYDIASVQDTTLRPMKLSHKDGQDKRKK